MSNAWKTGFGAGSIILGVYLLFQQIDFSSAIFGIIAIAFGIGLVASD